uniref:Uncharacterized protein n=1 Tax=Acrobeloides nanus TaxID=290746 RepID=A0A914CGV7_9BILA
MNEDDEPTTSRAIPSQEEVQKHLKELKEFYKNEIGTKAVELCGIKTFFVSSNGMRSLVSGKLAVYFEEQEFFNFLVEQCQKSRGE